MLTFKQYIQESSDLDAIEDYASSKNVKLSASHNKNLNSINLSQMVVPKENRGKGIGSDIMNRLKSHADANKMRITLTPSTDFGASSVNRLKKFYKKHGFIENKGKNKDHAISDSMYRNPE